MKLLTNRFLALSLSVLLSLATFPVTLADDPEITDTAITDNVEDELLFDHGVASHKTVDTWLEREKAEENAWEGGAGWVDNDLIVE